MLLTFALVGAMQHAAWRAVQGGRMQWDAQDAQWQAASAVTDILLNWQADSVPTTPIGVERVRRRRNGRWEIETVIVRTAPLVAIVTAVAQSIDRPSRVRRSASRVVWLSPPRLPIAAAATLLGPATLQRAQIDGRDARSPADPDGADCGALRDTASIDAVRVTAATLDSAIVYGRSSTFAGSALSQAQAEFDAAWESLIRSAKPLPRNADSTLTASLTWQPRAAGNDSTLVVNGRGQLRGLLIVRGDLTLRGTLDVDGLVVVNGALNVRDGGLNVRGALLVRDRWQRGSTLGPNASVRFEPCEVARALAGVAQPRRGPFHQWNTP